MAPITVLLALQVAQSGVEGTLRDRLSGAPVPYATGTITEIGRVALTDSGGAFGFSGLVPFWPMASPGPAVRTVATSG